MDGKRSDPYWTERQLLRGMQRASLFEGSTLLLLLFIAIPLNILAGYHFLSTVIGLVHGIAFLVYLGLLIQSQTSRGWNPGDRILLLIAAFIPFGAFAGGRALKRKEQALSLA